MSEDDDLHYVIGRRKQQPAPYNCPNCGGLDFIAIWELEERNGLHAGYIRCWRCDKCKLSFK